MVWVRNQGDYSEIENCWKLLASSSLSKRFVVSSVCGSLTHRFEHAAVLMTQLAKHVRDRHNWLLLCETVTEGTFRALVLRESTALSTACMVHEACDSNGDLISQGTPNLIDERYYKLEGADDVTLSIGVGYCLPSTCPPGGQRPSLLARLPPS